ncbi:voltage-dependent T-type calcium channel subunit alpha-1I-like isoform X1 [Aotus nancymaae]|uniref:voltage-dependent T-type calcium channel subunit alpha-1I-like isoform X1 n=1 Tax=Aotus nancymaae TaxID=37293 RepID=UPI0030FE9978
MSLFVMASKDGWMNIMYNGLEMVAVDKQGEPDPSEPIRVGDLGKCFFPSSSTAISPGPLRPSYQENFLCEMEEMPFNPVWSWVKHENS